LGATGGWQFGSAAGAACAIKFFSLERFIFEQLVFE
jgi:hypothetical protein